MDTKYHKAANVDSGCKANPNLDSLMKYKEEPDMNMRVTLECSTNLPELSLYPVYLSVLSVLLFVN